MPILPMTRRLIERLSGNTSAFDPAVEIPPKVLIVDDNSIDAELLSLQLTHIGCEVHKAQEGAAGLDFIMQWRPANMIFIDMSLPGISGVEVVRILRLILPKQPFCIYTGHATPEVEAAAAHYGCPILKKPATPEQIRQIMKL